jgi:uncharacterized RDD family membrane protein YckC
VFETALKYVPISKPSTMTEQTTESTFLLASRKRRIAAFAIDHFINTFLAVGTILLAAWPIFTDENNPNNMRAAILLLIVPVLLFYFAKDSFKGISIGRWIMGIMVRDENKPNEIPSFGRLFLRNLFMVIWPVEFIVLATNDEKKRLGDKIAKTIVVKNPNKPTKLPRVLALIGVGITFFAFVLVMAGSAMKNSGAYKVAVSEIEKNQEIITETGGIKGYGIMPTGSVNISNGQGQAQLEIKVLGKTKDVNVSVYLEKEPNGPWKLIEMK